ncbi:methyltransferase domain-containing protein [Candidatus Parabeggiatoa sp. HSG14]|uniref:methyltransferase domain-containing protein n=1 Tax=Candidatus Parabeggiatoa sp. HSG14 TaxID=3055593 RepID=UPI0025A69F87|nr:methyltransferase domain-containing protein [Thiotrichales bacterium HSG14]
MKEINKQVIWETKEKSDIDMTTTGTPLNVENFGLYTDRIIELLSSDDNINSALIKTLKQQEKWDKFNPSPYNEVMKLSKELHQILNNLKNTGVEIEIAKYRQAIDRIIKTIVTLVEKYETLALLDNKILPLLKQRNVIVDVASGIGRFINYFSAHFDSVIQIDFSEGNINKAKESHKHLTHVEYLAQNIMLTSFNNGEIDLIFGNWILQYLEDQEVEILLGKIHNWLKKGSIAFFREGIKTNFEGRVPSKSQNPAIFRNNANLYNEWFLKANFDIIDQGYIQTYKIIFNNPNQHYWILKKTQ